MLIEVPEKVANKIVVKRDGKKVEFDGAKIALAIQKGFYDIVKEEGKDSKYDETDVNKVYTKVLSRIGKLDGERIKIEEIQDLIEEELKNSGYQDVYEAFSTYREKRAQSRQLFFDEKKQHKFLKALEDLGLKSANEEEVKKENRSDSNTSMGTMFQYGSTISRQFAITYLMKKKFSDAHENGDIYVHDMDFLPMGTTTCCQIDLQKLFEDGFFTGHGLVEEPNNIMSYVTATAIAIQANQNDQHGGQSIPAFDYYMAPGVLKTFKKVFKQLVFDYLQLTDFDKFIAVNGIEREIEKINTIEFDVSIFDKYCRESEGLKRLFQISYKKALEKTNELTYQAMETLIHHLNTMNAKGGAKLSYSSINLGTDTSPEGRMVIDNLLNAINQELEKQSVLIFPITIFKVKDGVNFKPKDPNYDLLELACSISIKRQIVNFSFIDVPYNKEFYKQENYHTEVAYMEYGTRIISNIVDENKVITTGRGNLSVTSINLPRIGIKHGIVADEKADMHGFWEELEEKLDLVRDQLIERFEVQCKKRAYNFPFLMGQGIWIDSEKLKSTDNLKKVLKHGTLSIGFIGLAECLKALTGKHHGESEESQKLGIKIIQFMRKKCDEYSQKYNLNFTLIATPSERLAGKFIKLDQAIYGKLKGITDKEYYTSSFHLPESSKIKIEDKIKLEAPYHKLTNGGHILDLTLDKDVPKDTENMMELIHTMKENGIGYVTIHSKIE